MWRAALGVLLATCAIATLAQPSDAYVIEAKESPLSCLLAPGREKLEYPRGMAELKQGGIVRIRMTFVARDTAPRTEVFYDSVGDPFRAAALDHAEGYRLPCLKDDEAPFVATQEFQFLPGDGRKVVWNAVRDDRPARKTDWACLTGAERTPDYPMAENEQGSVFASLRFDDPTSPPKVDIIYDGGSPRFEQTVREYLAGYRLPCMAVGGPPIHAFVPFRFAIEGKRRTLLKDATLSTFVRAIENLESQRVRFDFTTMSCPFEVRFVLRQPYVPNLIGEVESRDPNRRDFIEWLKSVHLSFPAKDLKKVLGDEMTVRVPCVVLDLL